MDKESYFAEMRRVTSLTWPIISRAAESALPPTSLYSSPRLRAVLDLRRGRPLLKPFLVYLCSEPSVSALPETPSSARLRLGAAAELVNLASYQCNSALDEKNATFSAAEKDEQQLAAALTRESAFNLCTPPDVDAAIDAPQLLSEAYAAIAQGQLLDLFDLTFSGPYLAGDFDRFLSRYTLRCELLSGVFTRNCAVLGARAGGRSRDTQRLLADFGKNLGIAMQIANDIGDLLPTTHDDHVRKPYQDSLSDLRNGRLTLPLFLLLRSCTQNERRVLHGLRERLNQRQLDARDASEVARMFAASAAWTETRRIALAFARSAKESLHQLPWAPSISFLSCMASIVKTNKYNHRLSQLRDGEGVSRVA